MIFYIYIYKSQFNININFLLYIIRFLFNLILYKITFFVWLRNIIITRRSLLSALIFKLTNNGRRCLLSVPGVYLGLFLFLKKIRGPPDIKKCRRRRLEQIDEPKGILVHCQKVVPTGCVLVVRSFELH